MTNFLPSHIHSDIFVDKMESSECKGEAQFHSVTNTNHKHEGEALDLDELRGSNPSSNSLMVIKVT